MAPPGSCSETAGTFFLYSPSDWSHSYYINGMKLIQSTMLVTHKKKRKPIKAHVQLSTSCLHKCMLEIALQILFGDPWLHLEIK